MSLKTKLLIAFLALAILPMVVVGTFLFTTARDALKAAEIKHLESIADLKVAKVENYFSDVAADLAALDDSSSIEDFLNIAIKTTDPSYAAAKKEADDKLKTLMISMKYLDVIVTTADGVIVYAAQDSHQATHLGKHLSELQGNAFAEGKKGIYFSGVFKNPIEGDKLSILAMGPIRDSNQKLLGVIAIALDMDAVYSYFQDVTGLGMTGETLIVTRRGDQVLFLNPLRHDPDAALKRTVAIGDDEAVPAQLAALGKTGAGNSIDYRNEEVISAWRYIPFMNWGIVAKIDTHEAFAPVTHLMHIVTWAAVILIMLAGIIALVLARSIAGPIIQLTTATQIISKGNLDYKTGIQGADEIGTLAQAFDIMSLNLKQTLVSRDLLLQEVAAREKLSAIVESSNDAIIGKTLDGVITSWNTGAEHIYGYSPEEVVGKTVSILIPEGREDEVPQILERVRRGEKIDHYDTQRRRKDGTIIDVSLTVSAVKDSHGNIVGASVISRDVTQRKQLDRSLAQKTKELESLLYVTSHDLNEPLRAIESFSSIILEDHASELDPEAKGFLERIVNGAKRLHQLLDDILSLSRVRRIETPIQRLPGVQLVKAALERLEDRITSTKAVVTVEKEFPEMRVDPTWGTQALYNLILNALKFAKPGQPPEIEIATYHPKAGDPAGVGFVVRDRGTGVPPGQEEKIFGLFKRAVGREVEGTGAGLAIVQDVARQHGGDAWVRPRDGGGSEFFVTFAS